MRGRILLENEGGQNMQSAEIFVSPFEKNMLSPYPVKSSVIKWKFITLVISWRQWTSSLSLVLAIIFFTITLPVGFCYIGLHGVEKEKEAIHLILRVLILLRNGLDYFPVLIFMIGTSFLLEVHCRCLLEVCAGAPATDA